jgi:uncharacterized protein (DUF1778 family)
MNVQDAPKNDRIYLRATRQQKEKLARAARLRQLHTTEFILQASLNAADEALSQEERIRLSERDFARFVELIENPAPPTPELRDALRAYRDLKAAHPGANL